MKNLIILILILGNFAVFSQDRVSIKKSFTTYSNRKLETLSNSVIKNFKKHTRAILSDYGCKKIRIKGFIDAGYNVHRLDFQIKAKCLHIQDIDVEFNIGGLQANHEQGQKSIKVFILDEQDSESHFTFNVVD